MLQQRFEVVTTTAGAVSIRNIELNEIMHNPVGPWAEANTLYIEQSNLRARLQVSSAELVVFDVGLGAAANALAALHCARSVPGCRLRLISFERDLELLRFALAHAEKFAHFTGWEVAIAELLKFGHWSEGSLSWELREGDFLNRIVNEPTRPDLIFYDPYSQKVNREMWTAECFRQLRRCCQAGPTLLFTYSQSTPVRVGLLEAGFFVGRGRPTGLKEETTLASTDVRLLQIPLGPEWLERWRKSHAKYPFGHAPEREKELCEMVIRHPQFALTGV